MAVAWRVHVRRSGANAGRVRAGHGDHVMTQLQPEVGNPRVLSVDLVRTLRGDLNSLDGNWPRESARASSWVVGHRRAFIEGTEHLVVHPFQGGEEHMQLPVVQKTPEPHAVPLVEVSEPVLLDHRYTSQSFHFTLLLPVFARSVDCPKTRHILWQNRELAIRSTLYAIQNYFVRKQREC